MSTSSPGRNGARFIQPIASSSEAVSISQKPAIRSLDSGNGPLLAAAWPLPAYLMRAPREVGCRPSPALITPAFAISSLKAPIAASSSVLGMTPASLSLLAFTITMNCIVMLHLEPGPRPALVNKTNGVLRHRHGPENYFAGNRGGGPDASPCRGPEWARNRPASQSAR